MTLELLLLLLFKLLLLLLFSLNKKTIIIFEIRGGPLMREELPRSIIYVKIHFIFIVGKKKKSKKKLKKVIEA